MAMEYHVKIKGQKAVVLTKKQWEAIREKDPSTGEWVINREDKIIRAKDGSEFNLRNYDGVTPVFVDDRSPYYTQIKNVQLTEAQRAKAHKVMIKAKMRWILKTGRGYNKLTEEEKVLFEQVKLEVGEEIFSQNQRMSAEEAELRNEFGREFWDVYFETDEDREATFARWRKGRLNYADPRDYNRWDFVVHHSKGATNEIHQSATGSDDGYSDQLSADHSDKPKGNYAGEPTLLV